MPSPPDIENITPRYAPYIEELQELFPGRQLQSGSPACLQAFSEKLEHSPAFREEMASMIRSFVYREDELISRRDLTWVILMAIAGPVATELTGEAPELKVVSTFVEQTLRPGWRTGSEEAPDVEEDDERLDLQPWVATHGEVEITPVDPMAGASDFLGTPRPGPERSSDAEGSGPTTTINSALSRALSRTELTDQVATTSVPPPGGDVEEQSPFLPGQEDTWVPDSFVSIRSPLWRRAPWALSVCAAIAAFLGGYLIRSHTDAASQGSDATITARSSPDSGASLPAADRSGQLTDPAPEAGTEEPSPRSPYDSPPQTEPAEIVPPAAPAARVAGLPKPVRTNRMPEAGPEVFFVSSGVMTGNLLSAPPPEYPKLASLVHIEGAVILQAVVARDGSVVGTHVLSGHRLLRGAAERAVRRWLYRPYTVNGKATEVATVITVVFRLHQ